jgi:hypothetical protein
MNNYPIKKIIAPKLNKLRFDKQGNIIKEDLIQSLNAGLRPGHKSGMAKIYCEEKNGKIISHNYGHAGEGWSILFASVEESIDNFTKLNKSANEEVTIIGLGVIGLTTALKLHEKGYKNIKIIGESFDNYMTSFLAGGLIEVVCKYTDEKLDKMNKLFEETFLEYKKILDSTKYPFLKSCIREVDLYTDCIVDKNGLGYLINKGIIKNQKVKLKIKSKSKVVNQLIVDNCKTFHVNPEMFMNKLMAYLKSNGVIIELRKINHFDEIDSKNIFNCSGLGSSQLNNDNEVYPICGHAITLNDRSMSKLNYILLFKNLKQLTGLDIEGTFYFMPKSSGFLGGTFIENYDGVDTDLNQKEYNKIIERTLLIFKGIKPRSIEKNEIKMLPKF